MHRSARNGVNRRGSRRTTGFAQAFTLQKLTGIAFIALSQLKGSLAAQIGNGTPAQISFRNSLSVALRNKGMNGFQKAFAISTAAALVPGPDQQQMMALVCPPKAVRLEGTFSQTVVYEGVPYGDCLDKIAEVATKQTKLLAETQEYIAASLVSQEKKIAMAVESQLAEKAVSIAQSYDAVVQQRVNAGVAAIQASKIKLEKQINNAQKVKEKNNAQHKGNVQILEAKYDAAVVAFNAAQKRDQEMRSKMWGLAGGLVDVLATPGAIFTSFKSFISVFMVIVLALALFAGMSFILAFVPGSSRCFGLLTGIFRKAKSGDDEGVKADCVELKKEMTKQKNELEARIKQLTDELTARTANRNARVVNITNLTNQRNKLIKQLTNLRASVARGATNKNNMIANLTRQLKILSNQLRNAQPSGASAAVVRAVINPTVGNVNAALSRANSPRAANAVVAAIVDPTNANVNRAVRAVGPPPPPPSSQHQQQQQQAPRNNENLMRAIKARQRMMVGGKINVGAERLTTPQQRANAKAKANANAKAKANAKANANAKAKANWAAGASARSAAAEAKRAELRRSLGTS